MSNKLVSVSLWCGPPSDGRRTMRGENLRRGIRPLTRRIGAGAWLQAPTRRHTDTIDDGEQLNLARGALASAVTGLPITPRKCARPPAINASGKSAHPVRAGLPPGVSERLIDAEFRAMARRACLSWLGDKSA